MILQVYTLFEGAHGNSQCVSRNKLLSSDETTFHRYRCSKFDVAGATMNGSYTYGSFPIRVMVETPRSSRAVIASWHARNNIALCIEDSMTLFYDFRRAVLFGRSEGRCAETRSQSRLF